MAVRFIIGRAGSGKTHTCLEAIRDRLRKDPVDGPRLVLLVPEQASLQMERTILQPAGSSADIPAAHRAEVLSFQRLAFRVLDAAGAPWCRALTEPARAMVLRHLVAQRAGRLGYYRRVARPGASGGRFGGFVEKLGATIAELIQEAVEPDDLRDMAEGGRPALAEYDEDPVQRAKLHDLHLVYQAYIDYLGTERLDPSQYLQLAREHMPRCSWLDGAELWVDGFASLSGQETLTLLALAGKCKSVDITVMVDPHHSRHVPSRRGPVTAVERLFAKTSRTYGELRDRFVQAGLTIEDPIALKAHPPPRFQASESLARLERSLFVPGREVEACADGPSSIELAELPSPRIEVDYAVSWLCRWIQESARRYRYRDLAIIVRDLEPYHDLVSEALSARGVPFFIDRRRPVAHHPLVELLRSGAAMAAESMSLDSVRLALKTGLLPIAIESADELENYLLAHGIHGVDQWCGGDWSFPVRPAAMVSDDQPDAYEIEALARINTTRSAVLDGIGSWVEFSSDRRAHTGAAWAAALVEWLTHINAGRTLEAWADAAEGDGELDLAEEHRQIWRDVMSFLDDLAFALADARLTVVDLSDVLDAGLSTLTLGLVPPMVDQVLVGSIERSRHPDIKAAVVLGFNEGLFPTQFSEDSILNDDDRDLLRAAGARVRPGSRARVLDEALLVYTAFTRASEALVITYATADNEGKALRPSPYVSTLRAACPGLELTRSGDPIRSRETWDVLTQRDLVRRLVMEFRSRPARSQDETTTRAQWNELYDAVRGDLVDESASRRALASLSERSDARISPSGVERLYRGPLRTSVSQLETYAACPFQHFTRYILRLQERAEAALEPVDFGRVHHAVLEDLVTTLSTRGLGFEKLSEGELLDLLGESSARVATKLPEGGALSDARSAYRLRRTASNLARVLRAQRARSQRGKSHPKATELPFGFDVAGGLPAMELSTPSGRRVFLRGYIDRVDLVELSDELLGIVVDYKRTRQKRLNLSEVYHGLSLQLLGYLLVLAEAGETLAGRPIRPIGALYVSLASQYNRVEHPDLSSPREAPWGGTSRPRGLLLADDFGALDSSTESGWSESYNVYRKTDGSLGRIDDTDAADAASFGAMLDHTRTKLGQLADGLLDGNIAVSPYRLGTFSPCSWCPMAAACRFEMGISEVRFLETLKRSEVFRRLTGPPTQGPLS